MKTSTKKLIINALIRFVLPAIVLRIVNRKLEERDKA